MIEFFERVDAVFRKELRDFSQPVPNDVWENIEQALNNQKRSKRIAVYKMAAAMIVFAVLGSISLYLTTNISKKVEDNIAVIKNDIQNETTNKIIANNKNQKAVAQKIEHKEFIAKLEPVKIKLSHKEIIASEKDRFKLQHKSIERLNGKQIIVTAENNTVAIVDTRKQKAKSIIHALPDIYSSYALNDLTAPKKDTKTRWTLGGEFSPLYSYRNITSGGIDKSRDAYDNVEKPVMTYSGGLNFQYKALKRFTIQAGIYYTTMGQSLDYMSVYANSAYYLVDQIQRERFVNTYSVDNSSGVVTFNTPYVIVDEKSSRVINLSNIKGVADVSDPIYNNLNAEIEQNFQYVEVPFLIRYKLIDKNIDLNIIGGVGANFLIGNDVYLKHGGDKEIIGKTNGVNTINYNGTFGFGIEYPLLDRLSLRLEPSIKYYINQINSNSEVESHPYSVGIYTGISYSF